MRAAAQNNGHTRFLAYAVEQPKTTGTQHFPVAQMPKCDPIPAADNLEEREHAKFKDPDETRTAQTKRNTTDARTLTWTQNECDSVLNRIQDHDFSNQICNNCSCPWRRQRRKPLPGEQLPSPGISAVVAFSLRSEVGLGCRVSEPTTSRSSSPKHPSLPACEPRLVPIRGPPRHIFCSFSRERPAIIPPLVRYRCDGEISRQAGASQDTTGGRKTQNLTQLGSGTTRGRKNSSPVLLQKANEIRHDVFVLGHAVRSAVHKDGRTEVHPRQSLRLRSGHESVLDRPHVEGGQLCLRLPLRQRVAWDLQVSVGEVGGGAAPMKGGGDSRWTWRHSVLLQVSASCTACKIKCLEAYRPFS